jgi:hypothetical protein
VARARRNKPYNPAKVHDRRSRDLPRNAEVAAVEVDDPLALEPGEKIVTLRSIRSDLLGRLHSHRQLDEAQYQGGRFRATGRKPSAARGPSIPPGNMSTAAGTRSRSRKASARPCCG